MNKIESLINKLCPNGVIHKKLGDLVKIEKGKQLNKTHLFDEYEEGLFPVINGGIAPSGYWNEYNYNENLITISQGGASAGYVNYIETKFWAGAHCYVVARVEDEIMYRYIYHFLKSKEVELQNSQVGAGIPSVSLKDINNLKVAVPPLEIQSEIVHILDSFTSLSMKLLAEKTARKKQFEYYRDSLLKFDNNVPRIKLGDICKITSGGDVPKEHWSKEKTDKYQIPIFSNGVDEDGLYGYTDVARITEPSVSIAGRGAGCGNAILRKESYFPIIRLLSLVPSEKVNVDYLFYCIKTIRFQIPRSGIPQLTVPMVSEYTIPVPSLDEQKRIVNALEKFDVLCNDLTQGLPAEIEKRQKQYEYYRDKLLSFKEVETNE